MGETRTYVVTITKKDRRGNVSQVETYRQSSVAGADAVRRWTQANHPTAAIVTVELLSDWEKRQSARPNAAGGQSTATSVASRRRTM